MSSGGTGLDLDALFASSDFVRGNEPFASHWNAPVRLACLRIAQTLISRTQKLQPQVNLVLTIVAPALRQSLYGSDAARVGARTGAASVKPGSPSSLPAASMPSQGHLA
jgi:hypothetical protein